MPPAPHPISLEPRVTLALRARPPVLGVVRALLLPVLTLLLVLLAVFASTPARAQCPASGSTCVACHEIRREHPVLAGPGIWHRDHAVSDLCSACHSGDPTAEDRLQAHAGLRDPRADPAMSCSGCHEADWSAKAARYVAPPPTAAPTATPPPTAPATTSSHDTANAILAVVAALLGLALAFLFWRERRTSRESRGAREPLLLALSPRKKHWSPYVAGAGLGLVVFIAEALLGRSIAVSGAFDKLSAYLGRALFPDSSYYRFIMPAAVTWPVWIVLGLLAGAFLSARLSGEARLRWLPDTAWQPRFGPSRSLRFAVAFVGAMLVQIGADIAGGCTSGLAISGGALLAPGAFVFMAGMFGGGIPTARLLYRGRSEPPHAPLDGGTP